MTTATLHQEYWLLTEFPLRLSLVGAVEDQAARFRRAWIGGWLRLPDVVTRAVLKHWLAVDEPPVVMLTSEPLTPLFPWAKGLCSPDGRKLTFLAPACRELNDVLLMTLIVHELAHTAMTAFGIAQEGDYVDTLVEKWGLPATLLRETVFPMEKPA